MNSYYSTQLYVNNSREIFNKSVGDGDLQMEEGRHKEKLKYIFHFTSGVAGAMTTHCLRELSSSALYMMNLILMEMLITRFSLTGEEAAEEAEVRFILQ